jgi:hypothetical protein
MDAVTEPPRALAVLGIDVGGVLVDRVAEGEDTSFFGSQPMETPPVEGAFTAIAKLCSGPFGFRVHIVSKAGPRIAGLTRAWLGHTGFFEQTLVSPGNLWFVRRREDKGAICRMLGITHFVDDRLDVLAQLPSVPHRFLFVGGLGTNTAPAVVPDDIGVYATWQTLAQAISDTT